MGTDREAISFDKHIIDLSDLSASAAFAVVGGKRRRKGGSESERERKREREREREEQSVKEEVTIWRRNLSGGHEADVIYRRARKERSHGAGAGEKRDEQERERERRGTNRSGSWEWERRVGEALVLQDVMDGSDGGNDASRDAKDDYRPPVAEMRQNRGGGGRDKTRGGRKEERLGGKLEKGRKGRGGEYGGRGGQRGEGRRIWGQRRAERGGEENMGAEEGREGREGRETNMREFCRGEKREDSESLTTRRGGTTNARRV
eukprot:768350-Hanusia_phi.AAC.3